MVPVEKIEAAYARISKFLNPTRLEKSYNLSDDNSTVYMKFENEQPYVKAFKIRAVLTKLTSLPKSVLKNGKMAAISSGNQGVALAYSYNLLDMQQPTIFVPETAPAPKIAKIEKYGGKVIKMGQSFDEVHELAEKIVEDKNYTLIDAREDEDGVVGSGTIGFEILNQLPDVDCVLVPIGSGGTAVSNASYFKARKPDVKVYAIGSELSPALIENLQTGVWKKTYDVKSDDPALKSLVGGCAKYTFDNADVIEDILLISDDEALSAVGEIMRKEKAIVEPDSAVTYAAYKKFHHLFKGKKTVLVFTGGNIDDEVFKKVTEKYY